jgi:hypothetical protein
MMFDFQSLPSAYSLCTKDSRTMSAELISIAAVRSEPVSDRSTETTAFYRSTNVWREPVVH